MHAQGKVSEKMAHIIFNSRKQTTRFLNPLKNGDMDTQEIEIRSDPLTRHQSVFNPALKDKKSILFPDTDENYLDQVIRDSMDNCFLCQERWQDKTPSYPYEFIPEGKLVNHDVVLFPNLFPLAAYHAVVMVGQKHYRPLNDFPVSLLHNAFRVSLEFIRRCFDADPQVKYFTINANYLFPAGASLIHPHLQILGGPFPTTHHELLLRESKNYFETNNTCYWKDLVEIEKRLGKRWVTEIGRSNWLAAYSPAGPNEVQVIWPETHHFLQWGEEEIHAVAKGLSKTLCSYHEMKLSTFNFSCFSGALDGSDNTFRCMLRVINRQNVTPHYRTDGYYYQKLLGSEIMIEPPEELALLMRQYFR